MQQLLGKKHWIAVIAITGLCVATLCSARLWFANTRYAALQLLPMPQAVIDFQLYGSNGSSFTQRQLSGQWQLVFFGFSHCVDVCPVELDIMSRVLKQVNAKTEVRGLFVSLDPERDTQTQIDGYLLPFGASIVGVRGNHAELARLVQFFGADYNRLLQFNGATVNIPAGVAVPLGSENKHYQVNHSSRIYLVNRAGQFIGSFPPPHDPQLMANDLQMILKR